MNEIRINNDGLMLRPNWRDECVRRRAAEMVLPQVRQWHYDFAMSDKSMIQLLMKHIDGADGFSIAKSLEHEGWCSDDALVEIMGQNFIYDAEREITSQWVRCLGVKLDIPIGAKVTCGKGEGIVIHRDEAMARYNVHTPEQAEGTGWVCNAEDVKLAPEIA